MDLIWNYFINGKEYNYETVLKNSYDALSVFALFQIKAPTPEELMILWEKTETDDVNTWYIFYNFNIEELPDHNDPQKMQMIQYQKMQKQKQKERLKRHFSYQDLINLKQPETGKVADLYFKIDSVVRNYSLDIVKNLYKDYDFWEQAALLYQDKIISCLIPPELAYLGILNQNYKTNPNPLAILNFKEWILNRDLISRFFVQPRIERRYVGPPKSPNAEFIKATLKNPNLYMSKIITYIYKRQHDEYLLNEDLEQGRKGVIVYEKAMKQLNLNPPIDCEDINKSYRKKVLIDHPDKGGSNEAFNRTQKSYELLKEEYRC